ncbi:MAG: glycosyltransferase family 4 protein [Candidatus Saccharibacteria bacterium]
MKKKKILIICQHFWPEGFRVNDICDYFVENNYEIEVLCGIPNYPKGKFFDGYSYFKNRRQVHHNAIIHRTFEIPRGNNTNIKIFLNYISFPLASLFHIPRLLTKRYDKIFIYQLSPVMMSLAGVIIGRLKKIETTMYVLDLWPENLYSVIDVKNKAMRWLAEKHSHWYYKKADKLVGLSNAMQTKLLEATGKPKNRVIVLPQACEKVYEETIHDKVLAKRFSDSFNVLFAGNISPAQSFETILEAAQILKNSGLRDINWIIVGDGMSRNWLEKEVNNAGLKNNFYFEGHKPIGDIPKYTDIADVLVGCLVKSNLLEATIPAKVMSYIAAGKPIVLAMDGEVQELINKTIKCGFVGPTEDAKQLANNIKKVYTMSDLQRNAMGKRGRNYHMKHLERNITLNKLLNFMFS